MRLGITSILVICTALIGCAAPDLPEPGSNEYREAVTAFYAAVASVQSGQDAGVEEKLQTVARLAPAEPASWYNLALLALRQNQFDLAGERLQKALELAPQHTEVLRLFGVMEITRGNSEAGLAYLRSARAHQDDIKATYALAQELQRADTPEARSEAAALLDSLSVMLPENVVVLIERIRLAAQREDSRTIATAFEALSAFSEDWPTETGEPLEGLQTAVDDLDMAAAQVQAGFLRNLLLSTYSFRQNLLEVQTPVEEVGDLLTEFVRLPTPVAAPSPPDLDIAFERVPALLEFDSPQKIIAASLDGEADSDLIGVSAEALLIGDQSISDAGEGSLALLDFDSDFRVDIAHASESGLKLYRQDTTGSFQLTEPATVFGASSQSSYSGVWTADIDLEGDLDLLAASPGQPPIVFRNNGDATFTRVEMFTDVTRLHDFAWADFDGDGDPDPALLDAGGELFLYANERMGRYIRRIVPPIFGNAIALTVADLNHDGRMDLAVLMDDGAAYRVSDEPARGWTVNQLVQWEGLDGALSLESRLFSADFDNNGALDLAVGAEAGSRVWLNTGLHEYQVLNAGVEGFVQSVADMNRDGRLDLIGIGSDGQAAIWENGGSAGYHWQVLRPRAGQAMGDQRINSFTLGGEIEIRAGLLYQKQPVASPIVHFGLGEKQRTDVARIIWPNGDIQSEFDLDADQSIFTPQRLKGSCPWLFTFDGEHMRFVTDFIWRSPLGLRINAQETAGIMTTEDWVKIRGDELVPRGGVYDVRITAELWETHFFDHVSLLAVDHPVGTEVFVDERFAFPPPEMKAHLFSTVHAVERAVTDRGEDVTDVIARRDTRYLDFFGRGDYQGITREHYVEIDLGEVSEEQVTLVAFGWVRPTDSSINVAISQGNHAPPKGIRLEAPDGQGGWRTVHENLGFPAGKTKTVLMDLSDAFLAGVPRKVRLHTNLEVYWDHIGWAVNVPANELNVQDASLKSAELRYRGFSTVHAADRSSPELPQYASLAGTSPRWRDLEGYYTRFGTVDELLGQVDDRYVIMNAGDELRFEFEALDDPPPGWTRDFILVGDGWVKDGDYNTAFSKTVIPLPSHDSPDYDTPPTTLWEDPVYLKHSADWQTYHTRYVAGDRFQEMFIAGSD